MKNKNNTIIILASIFIILVAFFILFVQNFEQQENTNPFDAETISGQSTSTQLDSIEKDLNQTDLGLEEELNKIEQELY